ncbi:MAG: 2-iminobutanoate/2-iminopropanoate deaminase [Flavobacteriales bacterium]|jgi:2-iminobutanoate/2-iminopropanoate deaminase
MKQIIETNNAPAPIGPYSQAVKANNVLYTSGQIAIDPKTSTLKLGTISEETTLVMENLKAVVEAAGMNMSQVVKCSIFISNMNDFAAINAIYGQYFDSSTAPARETVQVACLPKNVNVEISAIVVA